MGSLSPRVGRLFCRSGAAAALALLGLGAPSAFATQAPVVGAQTAQSRAMDLTTLPRALFQGYSGLAGGIEIRFSGSIPGSTFECQVDGGAWAACISPHRFLDQSTGTHAVSVREITLSGLIEATPFSVVATVLAPLETLPPAGTVRPPTTIRPPRQRPPAPSGSPLHVHLGPPGVITPDDVRLGSRRDKKYGCEDVNPSHPENVSHCGWPQITGMFFNTGETRCDVCPGTPSARLTIIGTKNLNDMLLGGTGDVTIIAGNGNNVLWADRVPHGPTSQRAAITAGDGNNVVYAGPGINTIKLGTGRNVVHAWQGRGTVTCASKKSKVRMMARSRKRYRVTGCTSVKGY